MSVRVWRHPNLDVNSLRMEFDGGEGGLYELPDGRIELVEVGEFPDDGWIELR